MMRSNPAMVGAAAGGAPALTSMNPWAGAAGAAGGMAAGGLAELLSRYKNPASAANPYYNQIPDILKQYFGPYMQAGQGAMGKLQGEYGNLLSDPAGVMNKIGAGYQQSPGFQFAMKQALQGSGNAMAAGGMAGSPMHEQENMSLATNLGNQDYNNYMQRALGMYGAGLSGEQGLMSQGFDASKLTAEDLASLLAQQGKLAYEGQNAQNQHEGGAWGSLFGGLGNLGALAAFM